MYQVSEPPFVPPKSSTLSLLSEHLVTFVEKRAIAHEGLSNRLSPLDASGRSRGMPWQILSALNTWVCTA